MINDIKSEAEQRMKNSLDALGTHFNKIRTGRAHPSILDGLKVSYYGADTPLNQVANVNVEDALELAKFAVRALEMRDKATARDYLNRASQALQ